MQRNIRSWSFRLDIPYGTCTWKCGIPGLSSIIDDTTVLRTGDTARGCHPREGLRKVSWPTDYFQDHREPVTTVKPYWLY